MCVYAINMVDSENTPGTILAAGGGYGGGAVRDRGMGVLQPGTTRLELFRQVPYYGAFRSNRQVLITRSDDKISMVVSC